MRRIAQLRDRFEDLRAHGMDVVVVLCQRRAAIAAWLRAHPIPFPILPDENRTRAKAWGVYVTLSYDSIHMAKPATFVVDRSGLVRYARVWRHQADHDRLDDVLELDRERSGA